MSKLSHAVFVILVGLISCSVFLNIIATLVFPDYEIKQRSFLEGRNYQKFPALSVQAITETIFQEQSNQYLADRIPQRASLLSYNAALQRKTIALANLPFRFDAYPTFFGSSYVYIPLDSAIAENPYSTKVMTVDKLNSAAQQYSSVINEYSSFQWIFAMPERPGTFAASRVAPLINDHANYVWFQENLISHLPQSCTVIDLSYKDRDQYYENYYRTDHHWQVMGGVRAYKAISEALGNIPNIKEEYYEVYSGPWWGSQARNGICPEGSGDIGYDVIFDQPELEVWVDGAEASVEWLGGSAGQPNGSYAPVDEFANYYGVYFHGNVGEIVIQNDAIEQGELLIVGDSFTNCMERFFSKNYHKVYVLDLRYYPGTLHEFLEEHVGTIDDAVFMISPAIIAGDGTLAKL